MNEIDLGGIEASVIARIQAVFVQVNLTGVKVESYPNDAQSYVMPSNAVVLVRYRGRVFSVPENRQFNAQSCAIEVETFVMTRALKGNGGAYQILQAVTRAFVGYELFKDLRFYQIGEELIGESDGIFIYNQRFGASSVIRTTL